MRNVTEFDPFDPETIENPFPFFAALRREAPVYDLPNGSHALVSRYADCQRVALDPETYSSNLVGVLLADTGAAPALLDLPGGDTGAADALAIADPPVHTRQRKLVNKAFAPRRVSGLEPWIRRLVGELFDALAGRDRVEWMRELAIPVPMVVICELLGLPQEDRHRLQELSDDAIALVSGINSPEQLTRAANSAAELGAYLAERFAAARRSPREDVLGDLAHAADAGALEGGEVISILLQLLTAGQESTGSLIGSAAMLLAGDLELQARLRRDPSLVPAFVEETLRLESPFYGHFRLVKREAEVAGRELAAGTRLMLLWASANRDESVFPDPERVDLDRPNGRSHLAFGHGAHLCIGAELARLEARVAIETLLERTDRVLPGWSRGDLRHVPSLLLRRLRALPLVLPA
jgi:cytochrome P450